LDPDTTLSGLVQVLDSGRARILELERIKRRREHNKFG
jgi:hypothetical protein